MSGTLYLCATPIGNLGDMSERAIETLRTVDLIAAEDTRNSMRLLNRFDIHTPMTSYHDNNRYDKARTLVKKLEEGQNIALITDAGMPGISDPGEELVKLCADVGICVSAVPGASAAPTALALSGLPTRRFVFEGFLPREKKEKSRILEEIRNETRTIILYEAPHRLEQTLKVLGEVLGGARRIALCRELTKQHEEIIRTTLEEAYEMTRENGARGEYVLVMEGRDVKSLRDEEQEEWKALPLSGHIRFYEEQGYSQKEAMKLAAKDRGLSKREVYAALLKEKTGGNDDHISE